MTSKQKPMAMIDAWINSMITDLIDIRHDIHAHPELGYNEIRTNKLIENFLTDASIEFVSGLAKGTGVLAHIPGDAKKAICLRADIDALPILEENDFTWKSVHEGCMHACGHDGHTTILLGTAKILSLLAKEQKLPNPVSFVFQPAEEGGGGGKEMVKDGCLDGSVLGPPIKMMFGLHGWTHLPLHHVATRSGPMLAADIGIKIIIRGTGGHAAMPQTGRDPILCAANIITSAQQLTSRNTDPLDSLVVSLTQIHGGTTHNIIPDEVIISGTMRYLESETGEMAKRRFKEIAESIALAHECIATVELKDGYPVTRNDSHAVDEFFRIAKQTIDPDKSRVMENPVMGGEDFSYYCKEVPSCFFALGLLPENQETMPSLHQSTFDFNDDAIKTGIKMFCALALRATLD